MSETLKAKAAVIYNVVEAVVLLIAVGLTTWTANTVIEQGKEQAAMRTTVNADSVRLTDLEVHGSRSLEAHERMDDQRVKTLEADTHDLKLAVIALQQTLGELKGISVKLESLQNGQIRVEESFKDHIKQNTK